MKFKKISSELKKILILCLFIILSAIGSVFHSFIVKIVTDPVILGFYIVTAANIARRKYTLAEFTWNTWKVGIVGMIIVTIYYLPLIGYVLLTSPLHLGNVIEEIILGYGVKGYFPYMIGISLEELLHPYSLLSFIIRFFLPAALLVYAVKENIKTSLNPKIIVRCVVSERYVVWWFLASFLEKFIGFAVDHIYNFYATDPFSGIRIVIFILSFFGLSCLKILQYAFYGMGLRDRLE